MEGKEKQRIDNITNSSQALYISPTEHFPYAQILPLISDLSSFAKYLV